MSLVNITYNRRGQPLTVTFRNGTSVQHEYDCFGTLERVTTMDKRGSKLGPSLVTGTRAYAGQPYLFGGKERMREGSLGEYDFTARRLCSALALWTTPDPMAGTYPNVNPLVYCSGNPVKYIDPTGCRIEGVRKKDAQMVVEDIRAMFPGDEFAAFRSLIVQDGKKQNGKRLAKIDEKAYRAAFESITLSEDQQALAEMVYNTIHSESVHKVEYIKGTGNLSSSAEEVFAPLFDNPELPTQYVLDANGGFPVVFIENEGGGGITTAIAGGTYSLIFKDSSFHHYGRAVDTGHELFGHGRSLAVGRGDSNQHVDAIQTENLILRVMGISYINTGEKHKEGGAFPECSNLPSFR